MIKTKYQNIFYKVSKKTNKKHYYGRYYEDKKQKEVFLSHSLNSAKSKLNNIKKGIKRDLDIKYNNFLSKNKFAMEVLYLDYIKIEGPKWSSHELKSKKSRFKKWILPHFGKMSIFDIKYSDVQSFINNIDDNNLLARKTQENLKSSIQSFFKFCIKEGHIDSNNPAQYVDIKPFDNHVNMTLTIEQITIFYKNIINIDVSNLENRKKRLMLILMIHGRRWGEAKQLCWSDIDFVSNLYVIPAQKSKTKRTQKHKMTDFLRKEILELLVFKDNESDYLFNNPNTKKPYETISSFFKTIKKQSNIPLSFRCQDFRHVVGTVAYQNLNLSLENIRDVLAHGSVTTTEIYSDKDSENSRIIITDLFRFFGV